jgi:integrase/recombinase XerD
MYFINTKMRFWRGAVESEGILIPVQNGERKLTAREFQSLADVPPEAEWFANIENANTRRAYRTDVHDFMKFAGMRELGEFRAVKRAHLSAWRKQLEGRALEPSTIRRKLSAIASLFDHLCEANAVTHNPADGVRRPSEGLNEGKSAALGDDQAKAILEAPSAATLKGLRDRAILSALLFHGLRRAELCSLAVGDLQSRRGVMHFRVLGKGGKTRYIPVHPQTTERINDYLERAGHGEDFDGAVFRPVRRTRGGNASKGLSGHGVYKDVVKKYALHVANWRRTVRGFCSWIASNRRDKCAGA